MSGPSFDQVKRGCVAAAKELGAGNDVGVLTIDVPPKWVVELGPARNDLSDAIAAMMPGNGSDLPRALVEARRILDVRSRGHIIVVSDGETVDTGLETEVRALARDGTTVSAICVGDSVKFDAALMSRVAEWGRGRFIFIHRADHLPKVLVQEARTLLGR